MDKVSVVHLVPTPGTNAQQRDPVESETETLRKAVRTIQPSLDEMLGDSTMPEQEKNQLLKFRLSVENILSGEVTVPPVINLLTELNEVVKVKALKSREGVKSFESIPEACLAFVGGASEFSRRLSGFSAAIQSFALFFKRGFNPSCSVSYLTSLILDLNQETWEVGLLKNVFLVLGKMIDKDSNSVGKSFLPKIATTLCLKTREREADDEITVLFSYFFGECIVSELLTDISDRQKIQIKEEAIRLFNSFSGKGGEWLNHDPTVVVLWGFYFLSKEGVLGGLDRRFFSKLGELITQSVLNNRVRRERDISTLVYFSASMLCNKRWEDVTREDRLSLFEIVLPLTLKLVIESCSGRTASEVVRGVSFFADMLPYSEGKEQELRLFEYFKKIEVLTRDGEYVVTPKRIVGIVQSLNGFACSPWKPFFKGKEEFFRDLLGSLIERCMSCPSAGVGDKNEIRRCVSTFKEISILSEGEALAFNLALSSLGGAEPASGPTALRSPKN